MELPIDRNSEAFKLITRVQDEAHRFAIEYHRSLRSKDQVKSVLVNARAWALRGESADEKLSIDL